MVTALLDSGLSATTPAAAGKSDSDGKIFCHVTSLPKETTEEEREHCNQEASASGEKHVEKFECKVNDDDFAVVDDGNLMSSCSSTMSNMKQPLRWEGARDDNDTNNPNDNNPNDNFIIDLTDVPQQEPILSKGNKTSKYRGVSFHKATKSWRARIMIEGKLHHIGRYGSQEDAARDYARALFKYKCTRNGHPALHQSSAATAANQTTVTEHQPPHKKRRSNCVHPGVPVVHKPPRKNALVHKPPRKKRRSNCVDLTDVPARPLILNNRKGTSSKYKGVTFCKNRKKWVAYITVSSHGRLYYVGAYNDEQEAAADYARAAYKYNGIFVPPIQKKEPTYDYPNVFFNMVTKKWMASVTMDGKRHLVGCYDSLSEATDKYTEAVLNYKALALNRKKEKYKILSEHEVSMCLLQLGSE